MASRIVGKIEDYARDPDSLANMVITMSTGHRRLRVGDFRVIFREDAAGLGKMVLQVLAERRLAEGANQNRDDRDARGTR